MDDLLALAPAGGVWFDGKVPCRFFRNLVCKMLGITAPAKPVAVLEFAVFIVVEINGLPRVLFD